MANPEHLKILKQGVETWNNWRREHRHVKIHLDGASLWKANLYGANLRDANLRGANLRDTNLSEADLRKSNLSETDLNFAKLTRAKITDSILVHAEAGHADFSKADLSEANLSEAHISNSDLRRANLSGANLYRAMLAGGNNLCRANLSYAYLVEADLHSAELNFANLSDADFQRANLKGVDLRDADLRRANLRNANLSGANLGGAHLKGPEIGETSFGGCDLSDVSELQEFVHIFPSMVDMVTLRLFKGNLPEKFLRGCGLSDLDIEYAKLFSPELSSEETDEILYKIHDLRVHQSIQISPLFISYSHANSNFVDKIESQSNQLGIRSWRDVRHAKAGPLEKQIDRAIRYNPTVLLVLSENSMKSDWVEHEVRFSRELEKETERHVLCPVALDDSWKSSPWPKRIMEQVMEYNILDFSKWEDEGEFEKQFKKLIDGLDLFYK